MVSKGSSCPFRVHSLCTVAVPPSVSLQHKLVEMRDADFSREGGGASWNHGRIVEKEKKPKWKPSINHLKGTHLKVGCYCVKTIRCD